MLRSSPPLATRRVRGREHQLQPTNRSTTTSRPRRGRAQPEEVAMMTPRSVAVASPGRAEKLPAPPGLARLFMRKSRCRSAIRASPMFGMRSRSVGPTGGRASGAEGEEPSSPKVTCIGQVRIKAGKNYKKRKPKPKPKLNPAASCWCLRRTIFCGVFSKRKKRTGREPRRLWPCWGTASPGKQSFGKRRNEVAKEGDRVVALGLGGVRESRIGSEVEQNDEELARLSNFTEEPASFLNFPEEPAHTWNYAHRPFISLEETLDRDKAEEKERKEGQDAKVCASSETAVPPKNALLLMRCRSAPQHHNRFAPSPLTSANATMEAARVKEAEKETGVVVEKKELEEEEKTGESQKGSEEEEEEPEEEEEEEEEMRCSSARPLVLTRCKSEPARKGEEMVAPVGSETASTSCFWAHGGSGSRQRVVGPQQRTPFPLPTH